MLKSKSYIFGPQIRKLVQYVKFDDRLGEVEKTAWESFINVTTNSFGGGRGRKS
jgi:hypothetical protein